MRLFRRGCAALAAACLLAVAFAMGATLVWTAWLILLQLTGI